MKDQPSRRRYRANLRPRGPFTELSLFAPAGTRRILQILPVLSLCFWAGQKLDPNHPYSATAQTSTNRTVPSPALMQQSAPVRLPLASSGTPEPKLAEKTYPNAVKPPVDPQPKKQDRTQQLTFSGAPLFEPGSAVLTPHGRVTLGNSLAQLHDWAKETHATIQVESHTDSSPVVKFRRLYASNWELSAARSATVARFLETNGIPAEKIASVGYGSSRPIRSGNSEQSRNQNRRLIVKLDRNSNPQETNQEPNQETNQERINEKP